MKTYLVTGGAGFIGSNFVTFLLNRASDVRIINVDKLSYAGNLDNLAGVMADKRHIFCCEDICDAPAMRALFARYQPDYVVNFAAESHVDRSIETPEVFERTNVGGTLTLLEAALHTWREAVGGFAGRKFVQISTDEVYGSLGALGFFTEESPLAPRSPYSASKASADCFVAAYASTYGLPINITRCSNNYGPYQFPEKLIPLVITNALQGAPVPVYGDGLNVRDWLYVEDHCRAIQRVIEDGVAGEVYNVGGSNECSNRALVQRIVAYLSCHVDPAINEGLITYVKDRLGHDRRYAIDAKKIQHTLGWQPETCFDQGIQRTIEWYLAHETWRERIASGAYRTGSAGAASSAATVDTAGSTDAKDHPWC
ncbi:MAG: dTDP-glucose 4,6-dehydratase [Raoultibacter sp.]